MDEVAADDFADYVTAAWMRLDEATAEVPPPYRAAPLDGIRRRVRLRRATATAVASAALVAALLGGLAVTRAVAGGPRPQPPAGPAPSAIAPVSASGSAPVSADPATQPWASAMVSRDERTVTVYTGTARCHDLAQARADVTVQDATQVVIAVHARVVDAADCSTSGFDIPVTLTLPADLGTRAVRDGRDGGARQVYHERDLPDLTGTGWSPIPQVSWQAGDEGWYGGYNGPGGASLQLKALPGKWSSNAGSPVTTVRLGTRQGTVTGGPGMWKVWWQAGDAKYSLEYEPTEGGTFTLQQFTQLLGTLRWT